MTGGGTTTGGTATEEAAEITEGGRAPEIAEGLTKLIATQPEQKGHE